MNLEIIRYILLGFLLLMVIMALPLLYKLWQTVEEINQTLRTLNARLPFILKNIEEIADNVNEATTNVNARISELSSAFQRVQALLGGFHGVKEAVRSQKRFTLLRNALPLIKGVKTFFQVLNTSSRNQG
jgi:uncharacterized protein YoxC